MKYKNVTEGQLRFRAFNTKGKKIRFILKPGEEIELGKKAIFPGLEQVSEEAKKKTK